MKVASFWFLAAWMISGTAFSQNDTPGGVLNMGRWVGYIQLAGQEEAFATTVDTLIVQPDDATEFPHLEAILRLSLGGFSGGEYESENYVNIQYDFGSGLLTFDEPGTDLSISAYVYTSPHRIEGQVFSRLTAQSGTIRLEYAEDDEPGGGNDGDEPGGNGNGPAFSARPASSMPPFRPSLAGQYEGTCAGQRAILQIETGRGLEDGSATGLEHYGIRGALGFEDNLVCRGMGSVGRPAWCVDRAYTSGNFDFLLGRLLLNARLGADTCDLGARGELVCQVRIRDANRTCNLRKTDVATAPFSRSEPRYVIRTTAEQRRPLPEPEAPLHEALLAALGGTFSGFLYHEGRDRYQPLKINVVSSRSTPNPHNENGIYVSPTAVLYFGDRFSADFWPHILDRRPFYLRPGFILHGADTDAELQVTDWRMGVISGTWYSKLFGKVGTFELVKSTTLPPLDSAAKFIPSVIGEFRGPRDRAEGFYDQWWLQTVVPVQTRNQGRNVLDFQGNYQMFTDSTPWPRRQVQRATYDVYSGMVSFFAEREPDEPTFVMGKYESGDTLKLFWPSAQKWGVSFFDFDLNTYARTR